MSEMHKFIKMIAAGQHLGEYDCGHMFQIIMSGGATPAQIAAALMGMERNGITAGEISGAAKAANLKARKFDLPKGYARHAVDTCGTGGDGKSTYNISTTVAFVVAGAGVPVVKHGNKAVSSRSGSADVLRELGVNIDTDADAARACLEASGLCFLMAPLYHPAMRYVASIRQDMGMRTIFNLLGPLANPAGNIRRIIGVYNREIAPLMARTLIALEVPHAWVVHGSDGMDEITLAGETYVHEVKDGWIREFSITPQDFGLEPLQDEGELTGGDVRENALAIRRILDGQESAYRNIVLMNSAAALTVSGKAEDMHQGMDMARESIDGGGAKQVLEKLISISNEQIL